MMALRHRCQAAAFMLRQFDSTTIRSKERHFAIGWSPRGSDVAEFGRSEPLLKLRDTARYRAQKTTASVVPDGQFSESVVVNLLTRVV